MSTSGSYPPAVVNVSSEITDTQLVVEWEFETAPDPPYQTPVRVVVDGETVTSRQGNLFAKGPYTEDVNLVELPAGENMPVALEFADYTVSAGSVTVVDGGGGSRLPPGSEPPEPEPERLELQLNNVSSPRGGVAVVEWTAENPLTPGSGNRVVGGTVEVTLDGELVDAIQLSLPPADTRRETVEIQGVSSGRHEICVRLGGNN